MWASNGPSGYLRADSTLTFTPGMLDRACSTSKNVSRGTFVFTEEGIDIQNVNGAVEGNQFVLNGHISGYSPSAPAEITIEGRNIQIPENPRYVNSMPRLQPEDPRFDRNQDMYDMRANEDKLLDRAGWVDQPGGTLRVSIDDAIDAIARRGVAPFPPTGAPAPSPAATASAPALPPAKPLG